MKRILSVCLTLILLVNIFVYKQDNEKADALEFGSLTGIGTGLAGVLAGTGANGGVMTTWIHDLLTSMGFYKTNNSIYGRDIVYTDLELQSAINNGDIEVEGNYVRYSDGTVIEYENDFISGLRGYNPIKNEYVTDSEKKQLLMNVIGTWKDGIGEVKNSLVGIFKDVGVNTFNDLKNIFTLGGQASKTDDNNTFWGKLSQLPQSFIDKYNKIINAFNNVNYEKNKTGSDIDHIFETGSTSQNVPQYINPNYLLRNLPLEYKENIKNSTVYSVLLYKNVLYIFADDKPLKWLQYYPNEGYVEYTDNSYGMYMRNNRYFSVYLPKAYSRYIYDEELGYGRSISIPCNAYKYYYSYASNRWVEDTNTYREDYDVRNYKILYSKNLTFNVLDESLYESSQFISHYQGEFEEFKKPVVTSLSLGKITEYFDQTSTSDSVMKQIDDGVKTYDNYSGGTTELENLEYIPLISQSLEEINENTAWSYNIWTFLKSTFSGVPAFINQITNSIDDIGSKITVGTKNALEQLEKDNENKNWFQRIESQLDILGSVVSGGYADALEVQNGIREDLAEDGAIGGILTGLGTKLNDIATGIGEISDVLGVENPALETEETKAIVDAQTIIERVEPTTKQKGDFFTIFFYIPYILILLLLLFLRILAFIGAVFAVPASPAMLDSGGFMVNGINWLKNTYIFPSSQTVLDMNNNVVNTGVISIWNFLFLIVGILITFGIIKGVKRYVLRFNDGGD